MNVWSGAIALNGESQLEGLRLIDPTSNWQSDLTKDSSLSFRSFVNPALIPLYARAGPNLELHTTDNSTSQWLKDKLLGSVWLEEEDSDKFQSIQCPVGLLVGVEGMRKTSGSNTSDFLVYGVLFSTTSFEGPPTPHISSSEYPETLPPVTRQGLRIYASPLSASVITKAQALPTPPRNPDGLADDAQFAEFLPDLRSPSPKRKRVASLFESVAQHHRRVRQKGGEAVAQIMAPSHSQSSQQPQPLRIKRESEEPSLPALDRIASHRPRSMSIGNLKPLESRPSSSRGHARGLVSRKNTPTPFLETSMKREYPPVETKPEPSSTIPKDAETVISENKNTITRTILTCMRLYGFNRPSTRSGTTSKHTEDGPDSHPPTADGTASTTEEDDFKAMYHATYRASTFALRKYLKEPVVNDEDVKALPPLLEKKKAMGYIDEFLRLFCEEN